MISVTRSLSITDLMSRFVHIRLAAKPLSISTTSLLYERQIAVKVNPRLIHLHSWRAIASTRIAGVQSIQITAPISFDAK